ncbi:hypothetical protein [Psychroflexus salis]|uniref:Outer membrane protein beta-barrel domain-containing protein n=1 Tax=Psychroflexus salis TaxID=1526574 RepID=A0A916ZPU4_9FLAO|nr:hypothetical protein [Psychroflexus salis]GGE08361.1 hypothetical protein GCM10010831_07400 [Psychroflexus salis]
MKKVLLVLAIALVSVQFSNAQENMFSAEVQAGVPTGDFSDFYDFGIGVNATYYFVELAEGFYLGGRGGYSTFTTSEDALDSFDFITLAASGRFNFSENIFARADLGYAVGLSDNADGALFYEPRVGYDTGAFEVSVYYQSITEDAIDLNSFGVALGYKF